MPKVIKFSGTSLSKTRGKGNMRIGANSHDYGTSYYSMIEPPDGGYTVYENKASGGPSIKVADNEAELIDITRESSGITYASAAECLAWFATQTDKMVVSSNDTFDDHVTDGLVLELDASNLPSYPTTGTTWYDLSGNNNHAVLSSPFDSEFSFNSNHFSSRPTTQLNELDPSDGSVWEVSYSSELSPTTEWSVCGLLKINGAQSSNGTGWFHKTGNGDERGIHIEPIGNNFRINGVSNWSHLNVNVSAYHNKWTYYTATYKTTGTYGTSTGNLKFYANGVLIGSVSTFIPKADTTSIIRLGRRNGHYQHFLNGDTATYQYYTKELSESEIKQNYYKGKCVIDNLKLYLDADNLVSTQNESAWYDISGNGYNATKYGSPTLTTLGGAKCWNFDSIGDYFDINNTFGGLSACTLEAWIYPAASELSAGDRGTIIQGTIYMSWNKSNRRLSSYWYSTNNQGYHEPSKQLNREEWHHLCTVWTGTQLLQYIDGKLENTVSTTVSNGSMGVRIGRESDGRQFAGGIGMIKVYTDALTESEVQTNFNSYRNRFGK
jgi:hypothetical protein